MTQLWYWFNPEQESINFEDKLRKYGKCMIQKIVLSTHHLARFCSRDSTPVFKLETYSSFLTRFIPIANGELVVFLLILWLRLKAKLTFNIWVESMTTVTKSWWMYTNGSEINSRYKNNLADVIAIMILHQSVIMKLSLMIDLRYQ